MVTIARIVLMPIPVYLLYGDAEAQTWALMLIITLGLTDWVDGIMARREGPSVLGGLLDPIADKIFIAVIYLPLTDLGVVPLWMTALIFARDFLVTTLRTSLMLRNAPMRTSTLAKFKTAMQMVGIGYVTLYVAFDANPDSIWVWLIIGLPIGLPLGLIVYRFFKGQKQGLRSSVMMALMIFAVGLRYFAGPQLAITVSLWIITAMTVLSGASYLVDAWSALKGQPGSIKETMRFVLEGVAVPVSFVLMLGRYDTVGMSGLIILAVSLELSVGGLGNLLANKQITPRFRFIALKSGLQVALCGSAFVWSLNGIQADSPVGPACMLGALAVTLAYAIGSFVKHRSVYLGVI